MIILLPILIFIIIFFVTIMIIDCHRLVIREYEVTSSKINNDIKAVFLTDLHGTEFGKNNEKLISKIINLKPDMVFISGDMYTAVKKDTQKGIKDLIYGLEGVCPIYYANGNHEEKTKNGKNEFGNTYEEFLEFLKNHGVEHLYNEKYYDADNNILIVGMGIPFKYYIKSLKLELKEDEINSLIGEEEDDKFQIMLAHNPEYFETYAKWGADLVLSGHYHGGLMRLPLLGGVISPRYKLFPKYDFGVFKKDESTMILSCGLGTHTLPIRIFNPGEISVVHIYNECK